MSRAMRKKLVWLPYDMDTAIGINNEGSLVFSYNLEDIDQTEGGADVFNGQQSVMWNNLRAAFYPELKAMYQNLRSTGAISYAKVERMFEEHQNKWPEAIFSEDAYFKYLAPLVNPDPGKEPTAAYLSMLQGSKAEQRKWWLYNRFRYLDSKYNAGDALTDVITLRAYAKGNITVRPYADVYASVKYGSYLVQTRAARNQSYTLVCPVDELNDTEVYIYSASQLSEVGDLSPLKVGYAEFSYATRLRSLKLGDSSIYYRNANLKTLYLGANGLLQTLDVRNCSGLGTGEQKTVDISGCTAIENVYFDATQITGLTLPNGGVLKVLHLPGTITALQILNQPGITDFTCPDTSHITTLRLENVGETIDVMSLLDTMAASSRVRLFNFLWNLDDLTDVPDFLDNLDTMRGLDQSGNNTEKAQVYGTIHVPNATGDVIADVQERYPDITITYDHVTAHIYYYDYTGETLLYTETIADGANATYAVTPEKDVTPMYRYVFQGWAEEPESSSADAGCRDGVVADKKVYAAFSAVLRSFTVSFYNGQTRVQQITNVQYGSDATYTGETPVYYGTDAANYEFTGWSPEPTNITEDTNCYAQYQFIGTYVNDYLTYGLTRITFSDAVTLADRAFEYQTSLIEVHLPEVTALPASCFSGDTTLQIVDIPKVTSIGTSAFNSCSMLSGFSSEVVTSLGSSAFSGCSAMTQLLLPALQGTFYSTMVNSCSSLQTLDLGCISVLTGQISSNAIARVIIRNTEAVVSCTSSAPFTPNSPIGRGNGQILVPRTLVDTYKASSYWSPYSSMIQALEDNE